MKTETVNGKTYKVSSSGMYYHDETTDEMIHILENIKNNHTRVRFHWGNTTTGEDWGDTYDVTGTIGRSTGAVKVPLLIHNARSMSGGAILTHCIVKITQSRNKNYVIYQHPLYHTKKEDQK